MAIQKPQAVVSGTKILVYGEAGTRKSRFALTFPRNAYIDSDQGVTDYMDEFENNLVLMSNATTYSEAVDDIETFTSQHLDDFDTITLDSDTKIYENQQHAALKVAEARARKAKRNADGEGISPKEWGIIKLNHEKMYSTLFELKKEGKTVIVINEAKEKKEPITDANGGVSYKTVGLTPNTQKGAEFDFDIVLEMVKDEKKGTWLGAKVIKDRTGTVEEGTIVKNPSYDIWKDAIERKRNRKVKEEKRDFERDIDNETNAFDVDGGKVTKLITKLDKLMKGASKEAKKDTLLPKFVEIFGGDGNYRNSTDANSLQEALTFAEETLN